MTVGDPSRSAVSFAARQINVPCLPDRTPLPTHIAVFNQAYFSSFESVCGAREVL